MTQKIRWKNGARFKCSASKAYEFFTDVQDANEGNLDLDDAVERSRPKSAPLHNELEWDNAKAGHAWRRDQMRRIVRKLEIVPVKTNTPVRAFEAITIEVVDAPEEKPKTGYVFRKTEDILADPNTRAQLLGQAIRDALAFRRRYGALQELAKVTAVIDEFVEATKV